MNRTPLCQGLQQERADAPLLGQARPTSALLALAGRCLLVGPSRALETAGQHPARLTPRMPELPAPTAGTTKMLPDVAKRPLGAKSPPPAEPCCRRSGSQPRPCQEEGPTVGVPTASGPRRLWEGHGTSPSSSVMGHWNLELRGQWGGGQEPARLPRALQPGRPRACPPVVDTPPGERHHGSWFADKAQRG